MEWMATITGDHVGYPGGFGYFFSKEKKNLGSKNSHVSTFSVVQLRVFYEN